MNLRRLFTQLSLAAVAVIASVGIQAFAFTEPTTAPPQANAYAPINTGPSAQYKTGSLLLNTAGNSVGLAVHNGTELLGNTTVGTTSSPANLEVDGAIKGPAAYTPGYADWASFGTGAGGAAIYNDNNNYKALMIVGNNSAGGSRQVGIWDDLTVNGNVHAGNIYENGQIVATQNYVNSKVSSAGGTVAGSLYSCPLAGAYNSGCTGQLQLNNNVCEEDMTYGTVTNRGCTYIGKVLIQ